MLNIINVSNVIIINRLKLQENTIFKLFGEGVTCFSFSVRVLYLFELFGEGAVRDQCDRMLLFVVLDQCFWFWTSVCLQQPDTNCSSPELVRHGQVTSGRGRTRV